MKNVQQNFKPVFVMNEKKTSFHIGPLDLKSKVDSLSHPKFHLQALIMDSRV
jgi:hypothetical protein